MVQRRRCSIMENDILSRIHVKKPKGEPMSVQTRIANARKSKVRSAIEHVFAHEKGINTTLGT